LRLIRTLCIYFFISSRRRHTRFSRDWSSDVCSSDLYNVYRSDAAFKLTSNKPQVNQPWKNIFHGLMMNILNPKVMLFFLALFPTFIHSNAGNVKIQVYTLGFISFIHAFTVFCLYAILFSMLTKLFSEINYFYLILKYLQIMVFVSLDVFMLL